jgi:hypothetical protein
MYPAKKLTPLTSIQKHRAEHPHTPVPNKLLMQARLYAAQVLQTAYRCHAIQHPKVVVKVEHAQLERQENFRDFLHNHRISRARWSTAVNRFHEDLVVQNWTSAFADQENFYDYAITLYMFGKISQADFYNIIDVWQCLLSYQDIKFKPVNCLELARSNFTFSIRSQLEEPQKSLNDIQPL